MSNRNPTVEPTAAHHLLVHLIADPVPLDSEEPEDGLCLMQRTLELRACHVDAPANDPGTPVATLRYGLLHGIDHWHAEDVLVALDASPEDAEFLDVLWCSKTGSADPYPRAVEKQLLDINYSGPVALLKHLYVEPAWRGRGLGLALLSHFLKYQENGCAYALLRAAPMQFGGARPSDEAERSTWIREHGLHRSRASEKASIKKLQELYARLGFSPLKGHPGWMVLSFAANNSEEWNNALDEAA